MTPLRSDTFRFQTNCCFLTHISVFIIYPVTGINLDKLALSELGRRPHTSEQFSESRSSSCCFNIFQKPIFLLFGCLIYLKLICHKITATLKQNAVLLTKSAGMDPFFFTVGFGLLVPGWVTVTCLGFVESTPPKEPELSFFSCNNKRYEKVELKKKINKQINYIDCVKKNQLLVTKWGQLMISKGRTQNEDLPLFKEGFL